MDGEVAEGLGICRHHNATTPMLLAAHEWRMGPVSPGRDQARCAAYAQCIRVTDTGCPPGPHPFGLIGPFP